MLIYDPPQMSIIPRLFATMLTSDSLRDVRRAGHGVARRLKGAQMAADFFFQVDDPYGPLALPVAAALAERHKMALRLHLVPPPDAAAAPEAERLAAHGTHDATVLARALGLDGAMVSRPDATQLARAQRIAAAALNNSHPANALVAIARACQSADVDARLDAMAEAYGSLDAPSTEALIAKGAAVREQCGHYLGSVTHFEGECYWGIDRLHYLEARLRAADGTTAPPICPVLDYAAPLVAHTAQVQPRLDFYLSFRSPYTLIAAERIGALAASYGADLRLKFVLPMVMRGLPVPRAKRMYITLDTKREAARHGIPFGTIVDPVGLGVERGLAVLHQAIPQGLGLAFARSFLRDAFADGIDMTGDTGLIKVAERAGVNALTVHAGLADPSWRTAAEANRDDLFALGLWGVPSFQVDGRPGWWGQDRLWGVEDDLRAALGLPPIDRTK